MRRILLPFLLAALGTAGPIAGVRAASAAPALQLTETEHNWGQINQGVVATWTIHVRNAGDAPLELLDAKANCECTVPTVQTRSVKPGATGDILVTFDSKKFSGNQDKEVTIYSNDPAHGETTFKLFAFVIPPLSVDPEVIDLGTVPRQGGKSQSVRVSSSDQKPFKILGARTGLPFLSPKVSGNTGAATTSYSIEVAAGPGAPPGPFTDFLVVTTTHGTGDTLQAMIKGEVESLFQTEPASIKFGSRPAKNDRLGDVQITFTGTGKVKFVSATPSSPAIRAELKSDATGRGATLSIFLTDKAPGGRFSGTVNVKTDSADQPELAVKVLGYIRS